MSIYTLDECLDVLEIMIEHNVHPDHFSVHIADQGGSECYPSLFSIWFLGEEIFEGELNDILYEDEEDCPVELRDRILELAEENGIKNPFEFMDKIFSLDLRILLSIYFELHFFDDYEKLKEKYSSK